MNARSLTAKIVCHSDGMGVPSVDQVRERAHELALINGRATHDEDYLEEAIHELHGGHERERPALDEFSQEACLLGIDCGHQTEKVGLDDDGNVIEELVEEGMDEAVHDQMLAAQRTGH